MFNLLHLLFVSLDASVGGLDVALAGAGLVLGLLLLDLGCLSSMRN